jgi:uncharacterized membrane-anchored protein
VADRLFDRIMRHLGAGNEDSARFFVPMAVQAYQDLAPLDADGLFHLSLIHAAGGDYDAARASAEEILSQSPSHLLGLVALAQAARSAGDSLAARTAFGTFLDNIAAEKAKALPEYADHAHLLTAHEQTARESLRR